MTDAHFHASFVGIKTLLRSEMLGAALMEMADKVKKQAEDISPVGDSTDPHAGRYRDSFHTRLEHRRGRVMAVVYNTAPEAIRIEKGNSKIEAHHILMRALSILRRS
jgi:hypothetical protein